MPAHLFEAARQILPNIVKKNTSRRRRRKDSFRVSKGTRLSFFFVFHLLPFWSANWKRIEENSNSFGIFRGLKQKEKRSEKRKETRISKQAVTFTRPFLLITWLFKASSFFFSSPPPYTLLTELPIHLLLSRVISCVPARIVNELSHSRARWGRKEKETGSREIISGH